jgi:hypothetical protein
MKKLIDNIIAYLAITLLVQALKADTRRAKKLFLKNIRKGMKR